MILKNNSPHNRFTIYGNTIYIKDNSTEILLIFLEKMYLSPIETTNTMAYYPKARIYSMNSLLSLKELGNKHITFLE